MRYHDMKVGRYYRVLTNGRSNLVNWIGVVSAVFSNLTQLDVVVPPPDLEQMEPWKAYVCCKGACRVVTGTDEVEEVAPEEVLIYQMK